FPERRTTDEHRTVSATQALHRTRHPQVLREHGGRRVRAMRHDTSGGPPMSTEHEDELAQALFRTLYDAGVSFESAQVIPMLTATVRSLGYRKLGPVSEREAKITGDLVTMRVVEWRRITDELSRLRTME